MADDVLLLDKVKSDLSRVKGFLMSKLLIINAHNVDFFTQNLWEACLPDDIRADLEKLTEHDIALLPSKCSRWIENYEDGSLVNYNGIKRLFTEIRDHHLKTLQYIKKSEYFSGLEEDCVLTSFMMSPKKAYEVGVMSKAVYDLVQGTEATKVIDVGSGKGYLSQYLSLRHSINVVGIDSSDSNTKNAEKRNAKTLKIWHFLLKKAKRTNSLDNSTRITDDGKCSDSASCAKDSYQSNPSQNIMSYESSTKERNNDRYIESEAISVNDFNNENKSSKDCEQNNTLKSVEIPQENIENKTINSENSSSLPVPSTDNSSKYYTSYQAITGLVSKEVKIVQQLGSLTDENSQDSLVLVGLHTCGDLAPTAIKIFLNDTHVKGLCLVGCCYHLLSQPINVIEQSAQINEDAEYGFPVSEHLKKEHFRVSRNATMVAQQAADRLAQACKIPSKSILYRAILQVMLRDKFGFNTTGMHVGRIGSKCKSFQEYVYKSFQKLELSSEEITLEEIDSFYQKYEHLEYQIMAFHQLRACIAPCIESLFLLDRLCFLLEQGISNARIVAMFDPVKSPRSYAIIASKTK